QTMPPGWIDDDPLANSTNHNLLGWMTMILPQIDQGPLYAKIAASGAVDASRWASVAAMTTASSGVPTPYARVVLDAYICPSDPMGGLNTKMSDYGKSNYTGVGGSA